MTMITPSYLGETIEYSSLHACRSTLEDPTLCHSLFKGNNWKVRENALRAWTNNKTGVPTLASQQTPGQPSPRTAHKRR